MSDNLKKLHLGCFDKVLAGWINTDVTPHIFVAKTPGLPFLLYKIGLLPRQRYDQHTAGIFRSIHYLDVTKRFPYADGSIDCVFSSHLLEHLYPDQAALCIAEVYRVLKVSGIVRVAVPDLDQIVSSYKPQHPEEFLEDIFEAKQKREKNKHHWHYNEISLSQVLSKTGFREINRCQFQQGDCPDVKLIDTRLESLFMEATK